jgi:hypothetical protein
MKTQYISVLANGLTGPDDVIVSFYGPRGGTRSTESLNIAEARKLRDHLNEVLEELNGSSNTT